jgi:hypothetical protein
MRRVRRTVRETGFSEKNRLRVFSISGSPALFAGISVREERGGAKWLQGQGSYIGTAT